MKYLSSTVVFVVAATVGVAHAEGLYVGGKYMSLSTDYNVKIRETGESFSESVSPTGLALIFGNEFTPNLAIEGTLLVSGSDDTIPNTDGGKTKPDSYLDISVIGQNELSPQATVYGRAGFSSIEFKDSRDLKADGSGLSYGVGFKFAVQPTMAVVIEWMQLPEAKYDPLFYRDVDTGEIFSSEESYETSTLNLGIQVKL